MKPITNERKAAIEIHLRFMGSLFTKLPHHDYTCTTCNTIENIIFNNVTRIITNVPLTPPPND